MKPEASKVGFKCKGCELTQEGLFDLSDVVHDRGCLFYDANASKTFDERIVDAVVKDIQSGGKIREVIQTAFEKESIPKAG